MATNTQFPDNKSAMDVNVLGGDVASAGTGEPSDAAWGGSDDGSVVAILKAIHAQNETIIGHLAAIETNTTPAD